MVVIKPILVVTSTPGFGELIQQSLEETGGYRAFLVDSSKEALVLANARPFSLAILDSDLADVDFPVLVHSLRRVQERLCLIVIPPDNNPLHPLLSSIPFDGYLAKPFYLPDLLDTVAEVLGTKYIPAPALSKAIIPPASIHASYVPEQALEWLNDVNRAAQHLTRLSLESSAQAALIVRQTELWAYAGQLSQPAAQELASVIARFWIDSRPPVSAKSSRAVDMVRVVHLNATGSDYMLYVTSLGREMVLALAFDAETPFSTIRTQVNFLARSLASPEQNRQASQPASPPSPRAIDLPQKQFHPSPVSFGDVVEEDDIDELEGDMPPVDLMHLLDDVPLPDPKKPSPRRLLSEQEASLPSKPSILIQPSSPRQVESAPQLFTDMEELPLKPGMEVVEEELRPITPALHGLYYVSLMIPRLPQHHLTGELANALTRMISQLCLAYGWRLEHIAVRPEYLQWITSVSPSTSPSYLMRVLRQQTSERIFAAFPAIRNDNPSGDFWAPGYLIMSGAQLPPAHVIKEFIQQTRQHQGADAHSRLRV